MATKNKSIACSNKLCKIHLIDNGEGHHVWMHIYLKKVPYYSLLHKEVGGMSPYIKTSKGNSSMFVYYRPGYKYDADDAKNIANTIQEIYDSLPRSKLTVVRRSLDNGDKYLLVDFQCPISSSGTDDADKKRIKKIRKIIGKAQRKLDMILE